ncbi:MAG: type II toxin-antitoxin system VapC family toxin [Deltaproteobacteria bacterium]|nr:type II toxin-antitoxin system VapC family toxin [Deltaproteobacteria bacterium]
MRAYLDSSVLLRRIFGEPGMLAEPSGLEYVASSEILKIECFRTLDRMRISLKLDDDDISRRSEAVHVALRRIRLIRFTHAVSERAMQPFPTLLRTLDAIHLSSAILWREKQAPDLAFFTHDSELARAARAMGFPISGA